MESWRAKLTAGDTDGAWDLFIERYRRLILATIRRLVERDAIADVFAHVCQALAADGLARPSRYRSDAPGQARFSTWLVTVVHHQVIDWLRRKEGRRRVSVPAGLSPTKRQIFTSVFVEQRSHAESYETVRATAGAELSFAGFLKELAETYRFVERVRPRGAMHYFAAPPPEATLEPTAEARLASAETAGRLSVALSSLADDERAALHLFVVEGLPAADVARMVGWPNAKAVYNRVYRMLQALRAVLEQDGIGQEDV